MFRQGPSPISTSHADDKIIIILFQMLDGYNDNYTVLGRIVIVTPTRVMSSIDKHTHTHNASCVR